MDSGKWKSRLGSALAAVACVLGMSGPAHAQQPFQDRLVQPPSLAGPTRASLAGSLSGLAFGPSELHRGAFALSLPGSLPAERGAPQVGVLPGYSADTGLTEWGAGWDVALSVRRYRALGEVDYADDDLTGPWGVLRKGSDGAYYPASGDRSVRVVLEASGGLRAVTGEGVTYRFLPSDSVTNPRGTYAWYLSDVSDVNGARTELTYVRNASGRPFLSRVRYGGLGTMPRQYEVEYVHEPLATPLSDYRAGLRQVLDQRVREVRVKALVGTEYQLRSTYVLHHTQATLGPAFYLTQVETVLRGGERAPAVRYTYDEDGAWLAGAAVEPLPGLDPYLTSAGAGGLLPSVMTATDVDADGLVDFEHHRENVLLRQTAPGQFAFEPLPAPTGSEDPLCRRAPSAANPPRVLARTSAGVDEPRVVVVAPVGAMTEVRVCDRAGQQLSLGSFPGGWQLDARTRLVDLDRDGRPDLLRVFSGGYEVASSSSDMGGWVKEPGASLTPGISALSAWVHDLNGDGVADLLAAHGSGVVVWSGMGGRRFEPSGSQPSFRLANGTAFQAFDNASFSFLDANRDGLADIVLTRNGTTLFFINRGDEFRQVAVPGLTQLTAGALLPLSLTLSGSGEEELLTVSGGHARALRLTRPSVGLMLSADDGAGTVARFDYARAAPAKGLHQRPVVLQALTVTSSGDEALTHTYDYGQPRVHSLGKHLVGFGTVARTGPLASETLTLHHDDDVSGLVLSSRKTDARNPVEHFSASTYEEVLHQGLRLLRPRTQTKGVSGPAGASPFSSTTEYLAYARGTCPTHVRDTSRHGVLETRTTLASPSGLDAELHCLPATQRLAGTHADASLDFAYELSLTYDALGRMKKATAPGPDGALVLQELSHDTAGRLTRVSVPGHGATELTWDNATGLLSRLVGPEGVVTHVLARDGVSDQLLGLRTERGGGVSHSTFFRYDGLERLSKQWDDLAGGTELQPLVAYTYAYATEAKPARLRTATRVNAASTRDILSLQTAFGHESLSLRWTPLGWATSELSRVRRAQGETRTYRRASLGADARPELLTYADLLRGASELSFALTDGGGGEHLEQDLLQTGVTRRLATTRSVREQALVVVTTENARPPLLEAFDEEGQLLWARDTEGHVTSASYDALGRKVAVGLPGGQRQTQRFDAYGRLARVSRPGVGETVFRYDAATGLLVGKDFLTPSGGVERRLARTLDAKGRPTVETYMQVATGATRTYRYDYDGVIPGEATVPGQLGFLSRVRGDGYEKRSVYRRDGRVQTTTVTVPGWRSVQQEHTYHDDGSPRGQTWVVRDAGGAEVTRFHKEDAYDAVGRLEQVSLNAVGLARFGYDAEGRLASASLRGGETLTYVFEPQTERVSGYTLSRTGLTRGVRWDWSDRALLDAETVAVDGAARTLTYGYDERRFLTSSTDSVAGSASAGASALYSYDAAGLMTAVGDVAGLRGVSGTGPGGPAAGVPYVYDEQGRVVRKGDLVLGYGPDGHLERAERGTRSWRFVYDEDGQRLVKRESGVPVAAYVAGAYVTATSVVVPYSIEGHIVGVIENGVFRSVLTDSRGTVLHDGTALNVATPYGVRDTGTAVSAALDYAERGYDSDLGTVRMGVRDYDPYLGRFHTPDPLMLSSLEPCADSPLDCNLYGYARNNPSLFIDRDGRLPTLTQVASSFGKSFINRGKETAQGLGSLAASPVRVGSAVLGGRWSEVADAGKKHAVTMFMAQPVPQAVGLVVSVVRGAMEVGSAVKSGDGEKVAAFAGRGTFDAAMMVAGPKVGKAAGAVALPSLSRAAVAVKRSAAVVHFEALLAKNTATFKYYQHKVGKVNVSSPRNGAVFYSAPGARARAESFVAEHPGKTTLELTPGGKWLDDKHLFAKGSPLSPTQSLELWKTLSERFANGASGVSIGFVEGASKGSIFNTVEYPALLRNPNVTNVITGGH
ncbi:RHS repeat-associated core domain-containing protein [Pyxidicoccus xibeiensis]|uniref:RHS repeat-associated core domain-containing protein n=1 Tax=Pyxidicoccus xibeiensis TaxID=2906759 RepID=UPI0020A7A6E7|nr:RHS repeat-associated core domain-containing protein [Pyxidicoccus xibeiensis]MCP3139896.1 FG-GAP-like repeat-containing protein [Pyxidicoccus xibeiensis]